MTEARARKTGSTPVTPADLKEWIEAVPPGVAVTLPNGVTIDKRVVLPPSYPSWWTVPAPAVPSTGYQGYQCGICKQWVSPNTVHVCGGWHA